MNMYDEIVKMEEKRLGVTKFPQKPVSTKKENKLYLVVKIDNEENECQFPLFGDFLKNEGESFNPENFYISVQELVNSLFTFEDVDDLMAYDHLDKLVDLLEFAAIVFLDEYEERIYNDEVTILATDQDGTFNFSIKITSLSGYGLTESTYKEIVKGINRASQAKARGTFEADKEKEKAAKEEAAKNTKEEKTMPKRSTARTKKTK